MMKHVFLSHTGIIPPFPNVGSTINSEKKSSVQEFSGLVEAGFDVKCERSHPSRLLNLIRAHEKKEKDEKDYEENIQETVTLFNHLIAVYSRHGLLGGDSQKAEQILSMENSTTIFGGLEGRKRSGKKGKRGKKDIKFDDLRIQENDGGLIPSEFPILQQHDDALIFVAILRTFTMHTSNDESAKLSHKNEINDDQALLISLAAELCLAISQHIKIDKGSVKVNLAEYELLAQSGKALLTGLVDIMKMVECDMRVSSHRIQDQDCLTLLECNEQTHVLIFNSSLKLACSLVSLFGTKLSRSTALLHDLNTIAWKLMTINDDCVQASAARLLSCLPLAGGIDRKSPSVIWSMQVLDTLTALSTVLQTMAPLSQSNSDRALTEDFHLNNEVANIFLNHWIRFVKRDISEQNCRLLCFYRFTCGLTKAFQFFLLQDGWDRCRPNSNLFDAQLDIVKMLGIIESLVSFPLSSETVYYRTKRRLRDENIDNGLLSPRIIATEVANHIKLMGHDILDCTLAVLGGPPLLPYARRIMRISYASILTSSSSPVRKILDPTSAVQLEGKKRRWLHLSVTSRSVAIKTLGSAIAAFGFDLSSSSPNHSKGSLKNSFIAGTDCEKSINIVVGCLIEQLSRNKFQSADYDDDWGTNLERVELISASATCLSMTIVSCGSFISMPIRSLIESVVVNALSKMCGTRQPSTQLLSWSTTKISFLRLACSCVTTPWQDGASSALIDSLTIAANRLKNDVDREVTLNADTALRICDTIATPRAPALTYVQRAISTQDTNVTDLGAHATATDATSLASNIESARNEAVQARRKMEEVELAKKRKADERREREEKGTRENATKRQKALAKKVEVQQNGARIADETIEPANAVKLDDETKVVSELEDEAHSTKPFMMAVTKEVPVDENHDKPIDDSNGGGVKENDKIVTKQMDSDFHNDSDDEAVPEIFLGGPDLDDE